MDKQRTDAEPRPLTGELRFEEADFHALSEGLAGDRQYDDARLTARRKLGTLGKRAVALAAERGLELASRTSLHTPSAFNGMRVRRLWTYIARSKPEKTRLRRTLGADLAKDLDAAYRNAYLCLALEAEALEVSLRIHPEAWYDGQNLVGRVQREGYDGWRDALNRLDGFRLVLHDWKGDWSLGEIETHRLQEFMKYYRPGEHRLTVERRWPAPRGGRAHAFGSEVPEQMLAEWTRLIDLYRFTAWSQESDFLFPSD
jgi:hypothetical protein